MLIFTSSLVIIAASIILGLLLSFVFFPGKKRISVYSSLLLGISVYYTCLLLGTSLNLIAYGSIIVSTIGLIVLISFYHTNTIFNFKLLSFALLTVLLLPYIYKILSFPIASWDARSIWFFHAKMIFYGEGIHKGIGLQEKALLFSHPDYPMLVPSLAAWVAKYAGFWNEYIPKMAFLILLAGLLTALSEMQHINLAWKCTIILLLFSYNSGYVYNGYMDHWLATFGFITNFFFITYLRLGRRIDFERGIIGCIFLSQIKNEGAALMAITLFSVLIAMFFKNKRFRRHTIILLKRNLLFICISFMPFIVWCIVKSRWDIENNLNLFSQSTIRTAYDRVINGELVTIYNLFIKEQALERLGIMAIILFILSMFYIFITKAPRNLIRRFTTEYFLPLNTAIMYSGVLFLVYLGTPSSLEWHLEKSANRTAMPVFLLLTLVIYPCLHLYSKRIGKKETVLYHQ